MASLSLAISMDATENTLCVRDARKHLKTNPRVVLTSPQSAALAVPVRVHLHAFLLVFHVGSST